MEKRVGFSRKLNYILLGALAVILLGVGVYAAVPNPGHAASAIEPPSGCASGEVLSWTGTAWDCVAQSSGSSGISGLEYRSNSATSTCVSSSIGPGIVGVNCPSGKKVLGGGCALSYSGTSFDSELVYSRPSSNLQSWSCGWSDVASATECTAYVVCADE